MSPNDARPAGEGPPAAPPPAPPLSAPQETRARRWRALPLATALSLGLGLFIALAVGAELAIGYYGAQRTTYELVRNRTVATLDAVVEHIQHHLQPPFDQAVFLAQQIEIGTIDPFDPAKLTHALTIALAGTPQVTSLVVVSPDFNAVGVRRTADRIVPFRVNTPSQPDAPAAMRRVRAAEGPFWADVRRPVAVGQTIITLRTPLRREGKFLGALVGAISIYDLSTLLAQISRDRTERPFVLLGRDRVLAHPGSVFVLPTTADNDEKLPAVANYGDPVLAALWDPAKSELIERMDHIEARFVDAPGGRRVVVFRQIADFGQEPWIVGAQFMATELGAAFDRIERMLYVGLAVLALAVLGAAMLGRHLSRPIQSLAEVADAIRHLDLEGLKPLPRSHLREIDRAARAFNAMIATMGWVETYLPRRLVKQLIRRQAGVESDEREVTVLFTDIAGYTRISEQRPARELAKLLNEHFSLIEKCIADEHGTLDKYIGDSAMAFWNAPEPQPDHALRACRAAHAIAKAIREDAKRRAAAGGPVLRVRVGLHTGPVLVGNIGAPGRMDYTIIGDTVNTAQRLEKLGRRFDDGSVPVVVLASESTARAAGEGVKMTEVGLRGLAGRERPVTVYRLD